MVTDDAEAGVTQIVRGQDLLSSTPRQLYLQELLGLPAPDYYHVPLLTAPDGRRLSKRERDLDMGALRERYTPEALLGRLFVGNRAQEKYHDHKSVKMHRMSLQTAPPHV